MRFLAKLPELTDLFPGQGMSVDGTTVPIPAKLAGPNFNLTLTGPAPDVAGEELIFDTLLTLPAISGFGTPPPVLRATLRFVRHQAEDFLLTGLEKLAAVTNVEITLSGMSVPAGSQAILKLGLDPWQLALENPHGVPVATIDLPGMAGVRFEVSRLVLDASGVTECQAKLVPGKISVGNQLLQIVEGSVVVRGSQLEARLEARLELSYFRGASVGVQIAVSGNLNTPKAQWKISGLTQIANNIPWRDPSGLLSFDQMAVTVEFTHTGETLESTIRIGGRVTFLPQNLAAGADVWFGRLFSGLAVSFESVPLEPTDIGLPVFSFSPPEGLHLRAFDIFDMQVPRLAFSTSGLSLLGAVVRFEAGGAMVSGTVGDIMIRLEGTPSVDIKASPTIAVELAAPGGFKGQARLKQIDTGNVYAVEGEGRISSPALGAVEASFWIGRFYRSEDQNWHPAVSITAAQEDVNVTLFPGVVATRVELGAGINRKVAGVTGLSLAQARELLHTGLPDVFKQESWESTLSDLCVVARIFAEPSQTHGDQAVSLYVADMTLLMTSDLQFAAFGRLWFYTTREDAKSALYQQHPSVLGLAMFDGQQPALRVVALTRPDGRSSLAPATPAGQLMGMGIPEAQLAFEAVPSGMTLALGPIEVGAKLGPLHLAGSSSLMLRSAAGQVYAISRSALSATFNTSIQGYAGPATLSGSVSASFSASLALLGKFASGSLTIYGLAQASCAVELALHVRIGFRISIDVAFDTIEISWHEDWDFSISIHVDLGLEVALTSGGEVGIEGRATMSVTVLGISASLALHIAASPAVVIAGRDEYNRAVADINQLLGAPV